VSEPRLDRTIEAVLSTGLGVSALLLLAGLLLQKEPLLRWGVLLLMVTPAARVVVVTLGLLLRRDWLFAAVSLWILSVLTSSLLLAVTRWR
jgi:uncharacterized membrane protein